MNQKNFSEPGSQPTPEMLKEKSMKRTQCLAGKFGIVLCGALLGYTTYGQPAISVGVSLPLPSVQVVLPSVEIRAESDFYEPLTSYGRWQVVGSYGRCWIPGRVEADWRPYSDGYWQRTDAGWYWASEEPWAWATYHYGRWDLSAEFGWYWVPQIQWAPAWVSWHHGGGYIGWAPLLPSVSISVGGFVGFNQSRISPRAYVFVEQRQFLEPVRRSTVVVNNTTIINKTVNITNTKVVNNTVINEGPATAVIEKASGRTVQAVPVQELRHKTEAAVVSRQRTAAATSEPKVQTPVRSEAEPREKKTVAAPAPAQVARPGAVTRESVAPASKNQEAPSEKLKPVPAAPRFEPAARPAARPEGNRPAANNQPTAPKADKRVEKQEQPVKPADKNVQRPAKEKPVASEKKGPNTADKGREKKAKE